MLHHQIPLEMIMNQMYQVLHLKQVVVQQVQQNEVQMKVQQQHQILRVYIQMKIHQVQMQMNNTQIQHHNEIKFVDIICHMLKYLNEFFQCKNVQY